MSDRTRRALAVTLGLAAATISLAGPASAWEMAANSVVTFSSPVPAPTSGCAVKSSSTTVMYDDTATPESGEVTVLGVQLETWYRITITARDVRTGATVRTASALEIAHRPTGA